MSILRLIKQTEGTSKLTTTSTSTIPQRPPIKNTRLPMPPTLQTTLLRLVGLTSRLRGTGQRCRDTTSTRTLRWMKHIHTSLGVGHTRLRMQILRLLRDLRSGSGRPKKLRNLEIKYRVMVRNRRTDRSLLTAIAFHRESNSTVLSVLVVSNPLP